MSISTWVKFNSAPLDVKKTSYFQKIYKLLIIVKPPNEAQNYVESFLIKIFTKIQMWLVNQNSGNNLNVFEASSRKNGFVTASQRPKRLFSVLPKKGADLKFTQVRKYIRRSFIFNPIPMAFWLKTPNNIYKNWLNSQIDRIMFTVSKLEIKKG